MSFDQELADSSLMAAGGVLRARLLDDDQLSRLQRDAWDRLGDAVHRVWSRRRVPHDLPDHWFEVAPGGELLAAFYRGAAVRAALARTTGLDLAPENDLGAYHYYRQPEHYFGLHRDRQACKVAVITCLHHDPGAGGELVVYPARSDEPLEYIARTASVGAEWIRLAPGESAVLAGWIVPHRVRPMSAWRTRIVTSLCYHYAS